MAAPLLSSAPTPLHSKATWRLSKIIGCVGAYGYESTELQWRVGRIIESAA
jgi:hypothetical protein